VNKKNRAMPLKKSPEAAIFPQLWRHRVIATRTCSLGSRRIALSDSIAWPAPLAPEAFHGITGEVVDAIAPHTESDPAALLLCFLIGAGSLLGREPHAVVEAARHGVNLFGVVVARSSKGRKGTAWTQPGGTS
jgi:hypothetical protein